MTLSYIPLFAIGLINVAVVAWVLRNRETTRSGFFLLLNALCLIIWAGGQALYRLIGQEMPEVLSLAHLASLVVPGNFLYYALTRPHPLRTGWPKWILLFAIFLPTLLLTLLEDYHALDTKILFEYSYQIGAISLESFSRRMAIVFVTTELLVTVVVLGVRYYTTTGPDRNIAKHLIAAIVGPFMFAVLFWVSTASGLPITVPTPSFLIVVMAQVGLIVVLRQEEMRNPRTLSRWVYYLTAVLVAFVLMNLLSEFYVVSSGRFVLERTEGWMMLGATLLLLLVARFRFVESTFERILFARAAEYRKVVEETRTELREARERLRKAERLSVVGEVASRVAHEIKNPLGPIRGYTQMMREKVENQPNFQDRERFLEYIEIISEEVENIDRRVKDFLESARTPQLMIEDADVNEMVERCARVMRLELTAGRDMSGDVLPVRIETDLDGSLNPVKIDAARIEEALFNIARNALDAVTEQTRGYIRFVTRSMAGPDKEEGVEITVIDNGTGFPEGDMQKFFEPFFTKKSKGTGLGLAIVKSAVEAHGGTITLQNRQLGGSQVTIWLPLIARENPGALLPKPV